MGIATCPTHTQLLHEYFYPLYGKDCSEFVWSVPDFANLSVVGLSLICFGSEIVSNSLDIKVLSVIVVWKGIGTSAGIEDKNLACRS